MELLYKEVPGLKKFRKLIGIILSQPDSPYQHKLLTGLIEQAFALNYDVAVFSSYLKDELSPGWYKGEANIYNMINYPLLDGVIFVPDTMRVNDVDKAVEKDIREKFSGPVVSVDIKTDDFNSIFTDDIQSVKMIISHLIEEHKLTDIAFMTGIKGHPHSTNRLTGYYEALVEHGIPIDQSRVFYGDFWYDMGESVVQALVDDPRPMPQAIACGSDPMAISVCEALKARGYRVPEDVAVTGYDSVEAGINYIPGITSSELPSDVTGRRAMNMLHSLITKTKFTDEVCGTSIAFGKSCGCSADASEEIHQENKFRKSSGNADKFNSTHNFMLEELISEKNLEGYMTTLAKYTDLLGSSSDFFLALCENWDNPGETEHEPNYRKIGYSRKMLLPICKTGEDTRVNTTLKFDLGEMLPILYEKRAVPRVFYFSPVNFNERCFGYSVFASSEAYTYPDCYCRWMRYVCNSLESLRRRRNLMFMHKKMESNAVTDPLTGIYNRNGFNLYAKEIFGSVKENGGCLSIIMGDINNLKYINDTFGYTDGDFAVKSAADAFRSVCGEGMLCFRISGDEFAIVSSTVASADRIAEAEARIAEYLRRVNESADKPYSVSISMGTFFGPAAEFDSIEQPFNIADRRMFAAKEKFKRDEGFDYRKTRSAR